MPQEQPLGEKKVLSGNIYLKNTFLDFRKEKKTISAKIDFTGTFNKMCKSPKSIQ